jgi:hypothetical protein
VKKILKAASRLVDAGVLIYIVGPLLIILVWLLREMWSTYPLRSALAGLFVLLFIVRGKRKANEEEEQESDDSQEEQAAATVMTSAACLLRTARALHECGQTGDMVLSNNTYELIVRKKEIEA